MEREGTKDLSEEPKFLSGMPENQNLWTQNTGRTREKTGLATTSSSRQKKKKDKWTIKPRRGQSTQRRTQRTKKARIRDQKR